MFLNGTNDTVGAANKKGTVESSQQKAEDDTSKDDTEDLSQPKDDDTEMEGEERTFYGAAGEEEVTVLYGDAKCYAGNCEEASHNAIPTTDHPKGDH